MRSLGEIVARVAADVASSRGVVLHGGAETTAESETAFLAMAEAWLRQAVGTADLHAPVRGEQPPLAA